MTDLGRLESQLARKQRLPGPQTQGRGAGAAAVRAADEVRRTQKRIRSHDTHHLSLALADQAHTLVAEELQNRSMTKSAKGTQDSPGTHVKAKAGLNRSMLASNWGQLAQRLAYKCGRFETVDPRYTRQTCHPCGYGAAANRKTQAVFHCPRCDFFLNADHNAALNIPGRFTLSVARGTEATARREACPVGTSPTREHGMLESVYSNI